MSPSRAEYRTTRTSLLLPIGFFVLLCGLVGWVILGGVAPTGPKYWMIVIAGPPFFGGMLAYYLYQFVVLPPVLVIDEFGVRRRSFLGERLLPWAAVTRVIAHRHKKDLAVELIASDSPLPESVLHDIANRLGWRPRLVAPGWFLRVSTMFLKLDLEDALQRITDRLRPAMRIETRAYTSAKDFHAAAMEWKKAA